MELTWPPRAEPTLDRLDHGRMVEISAASPTPALIIITGRTLGGPHVFHLVCLLKPHARNIHRLSQRQKIPHCASHDQVIHQCTQKQKTPRTRTPCIISYIYTNPKEKRRRKKTNTMTRSPSAEPTKTTKRKGGYLLGHPHLALHPNLECGKYSDWCLCCLQVLGAYRPLHLHSLPENEQTTGKLNEPSGPGQRSTSRGWRGNWRN